MKRRERSIHFFKVSGAGNHFVLLDVRRAESVSGARSAVRELSRRALVRALCARGHSVGADGVLFVETSKSADFGLVYYNSDGREAALCGNGTRCAALYAFEHGFAPSRMRIQAGSGTIGAVVGESGVELQMGKPRNFRADVVLKTSAGVVKGDYVDTGVPHFVTTTTDWRRLDVNELGREIRRQATFGRQGANANFVRVLGSRKVEIRTYERGVEAETLACGTGAVAAAICLALRGLVKSPVSLRTRGGDILRVRFSDPNNPLSIPFLHGSAQVVYEGFIGLNTLRAIRRKLTATQPA